jgi:hypothetical protein
LRFKYYLELRDIDIADIIEINAYSISRVSYTISVERIVSGISIVYISIVCISIVSKVYIIYTTSITINSVEFSKESSIVI